MDTAQRFWAHSLGKLNVQNVVLFKMMILIAQQWNTRCVRMLSVSIRLDVYSVIPELYWLYSLFIDKHSLLVPCILSCFLTVLWPMRLSNTVDQVIFALALFRELAFIIVVRGELKSRNGVFLYAVRFRWYHFTRTLWVRGWIVSRTDYSFADG